MGALEDGERISAPDAATWRAWLEENHAGTGGVWLLHVRRTAQDGIGYDDAVRQALCFGWIDGPVRTFDDGTVGQWFSPRRRGSGWAATHKARLAELEAAGMLAPAGIRVIEAAKADGSWTMLDGPEAGIEPDDFAAALDALPAARENWDAFPRSAKKLGLTSIATAKRVETRASRIAKIVADALAAQHLDGLQRGLPGGRGVFQHDDALAGDVGALDLAAAAVVLRLLAHDERVERAIGCHRRVHHRVRDRVGAERQTPDRGDVEVLDQVEHDAPDRRGRAVVERELAHVDVVRRLLAAREGEVAVEHGLVLDEI